MKTLLPLIAVFALVSPVAAQDGEKPANPPQGELNDTEKKFVGKWSGKRGPYRWEIDRRADRTFEIAFVEPDPDRFMKTFKNYAVGVWWVQGKDYKFEWTKWWGDEGDLGGLQTEVVELAGKNQVITLSDDDEDPRNIEVRTKEFKLPAWKLKPTKEKSEKGSVTAPPTTSESKPE